MLLDSRVSSRSRRSVSVTRLYNENVGKGVALAAADARLFNVTIAFFTIGIHPDFLGKDQESAFQARLKNHVLTGVGALDLGDGAAFT